jgi:hypothetical protein
MNPFRPVFLGIPRRKRQIDVGFVPETKLKFHFLHFVAPGPLCHVWALAKRRFPYPLPFLAIDAVFVSLSVESVTVLSGWS